MNATEFPSKYRMQNLPLSSNSKEIFYESQNYFPDYIYNLYLPRFYNHFQGAQIKKCKKA